VIDSVWFADDSGTGSEAGTETDPTSVDAAVAGAQSQAILGDGDLIVVMDTGAGDGLTTTGGVALLPDEILLAGGSSIPLTGTTSGWTADYLAPAGPGTISGGGVEDVVALADDTQALGVGVRNGRRGIVVQNVNHAQIVGVTVSEMSHVVSTSGSDGGFGLAGESVAATAGATGIHVEDSLDILSATARFIPSAPPPRRPVAPRATAAPQPAPATA